MENGKSDRIFNRNSDNNYIILVYIQILFRKENILQEVW